MRTLVIAIVALVLIAGPALANQCPLLVKQLKDAVATMKADDPKVKQGLTLIDEAEKLHMSGKHADAVAKADEAAKVLGVELKKR